MEALHDHWAAITPPTLHDYFRQPPHATNIHKMSAESTKEATAEGHKVTTVVEGTDATAAPPAEPGGKVAIVTGASRGLGRGVAAILAKEAGFTVHAVGRTTADLETLQAECADGPGKVSPRRPVVIAAATRANDVTRRSCRARSI